MTDATINPFDPKNAVSGGGLWDDKTVTVTKAYFGLQTDNEGRPFKDEQGKDRDGHGLIIYGIADGSEQERREQYSIGSLKATADGEGFTKADGSVAGLHKSSAGYAFFEGLSEGGFDMGRIFTEGKQRISGLVGTKLVFAGIDKKDKDGKPKKNKKGYIEQAFFPRKTVGYVGGAAAATKPGNGAANLADKATAKILEVVGAAGGSVAKSQLPKQLAASLVGDTQMPAVLALAVTDNFLKAGPWTYDGATVSL